MVDFKDYTYKMDRTLEVLQEDFGAVRAGRANARVLDRISVEYYGVDTPIGQVGTIASPDARTLVIQPWDGSLLKKIEKAIQTSDLGINPQNDGRVIRLVFPQLTEERRRELTKQVKKYGEDAKVAVRNIRRDACLDIWCSLHGRVTKASFSLFCCIFSRGALCSRCITAEFHFLRLRFYYAAWFPFCRTKCLCGFTRLSLLRSLWC